MNADTTGYVGRFAPSPTGPLHFGSLVAALGSFVDARAKGGRWRLRIDDLDAGRTVAGARDRILATLEAHALYWDGEVVEQSRRDRRYAAAFARLRDAGRLYRCTCSRRDLRRHAPSGPLGRIYPGTCRQRSIPPERPAATRMRLPAGRLRIDDRGCGRIVLDAETDLGDVVLKRRDGIWAYHLATTIDDADMGVTDVVRGADLLPVALIQAAIQDALRLPPIRWRHLPLARTAGGDKLSKQTGAAALDDSRPLDALLAAWKLLGQSPPHERPADAEEFLAYAIAHWRPGAIPTSPPPAAGNPARATGDGA